MCSARKRSVRRCFPTFPLGTTMEQLSCGASRPTCGCMRRGELQPFPSPNSSAQELFAACTWQKLQAILACTQPALLSISVMSAIGLGSALQEVQATEMSLSVAASGRSPRLTEPDIGCACDMQPRRQSDDVQVLCGRRWRAAAAAHGRQ